PGPRSGSCPRPRRVGLPPRRAPDRGRHALRRLEQHRCRRALPRPRLRDEPHRPQLRPRAPVSRYGATRAEVDERVPSWNEPGYRAAQVWDGLYTHRTPLEDVTNLPRALRARLADALPLAFDAVYEATAADGLTTKWLWEATRDGVQVETV